MRKLISFFLCTVLIFSAAVPALAAETADVTISNEEEFLAFAESCRLDSYSQGLTVSLEADLDLSGVDFAGIPIFSGTFLGNGHTVSGLNITVHGSQQGLFRYLTQTGVVKDLRVSGTVAPDGSRGNVGGIVGSNAGVISNCSFEGDVSGSDNVGGIAGINTVGGVIEDCRTVGSIHGDHFVGGIAGENAGVIRGCENGAAINTTPQQNSIDISDITIGTITGTEAANAVTDIGGIAGTSTGTIRSSVNRGDVGYKHMGYNIGGIAGSQSGYVVDCQNYAAISGRKEVGGIVGHMEPSILLNYETDAIQLLQAQMAVLGDLTDRAVLNAQSNTASIKALIARLENHVANVENAMDVLTIDPEDPKIEDIDTYIAAIQTLGSSISGIDNTIRSLYQAVNDTGGDLKDDLQDIADQVAVINGVLDSSGENLGGTIQDASDADTAEDLTSKVESVVNYGPILGDLNVGGIVGAMALENDLDPEDDVTVSGDVSLNAVGNLRSVVLNAANYGSVTAKKRNAGGIVGWQSMGLVKACGNSGTLEGADYTGGIVGRSEGYIRMSFANCSITGDVYVGGIAGSGAVVTGCRSMVALSGSEQVGAVLGYAEVSDMDEEQPILDNLYVSVKNDPGAIDGISYNALAQPMELDAFLMLEDLPELFKTVNVTFVFEDGTRQVVSLAAGSALEQVDIPLVPAKSGFSGEWLGLEDADTDRILFDLTFEAAYTSHGSVIQSSENRDGRPILLVQGDFAPNAAVIMEKPDVDPLLQNGEALLESWLFSVTECEHTTAARYLLPEGADADQLQLYVHRNNGTWRTAEYTVDGSYIVFSLECGDDGLALAQSENMGIPWAMIAAGVVAAAAVAALVTVICKRRSKNKAKAENEAEDTP